MFFPSRSDLSKSQFSEETFWSCFGSAAAAAWDWPSPSAWLDCPIHKGALTTVLVDRHITDFIGRDVPVGLCRLSPAQLGHGGRHNIESQAPGLAGHWEQKQRGKSGPSGCPELLRSQLGCSGRHSVLPGPAEAQGGWVQSSRLALGSLTLLQRAAVDDV